MVSWKSIDRNVVVWLPPMSRFCARRGRAVREHPEPDPSRDRQEAYPDWNRGGFRSPGRPESLRHPVPDRPAGGLVADGVVNLWNGVGPRPRHWVVVAGLVGRDFVIVDDPLSGPLRVKQRPFLCWWARDENLCVLNAAPAGGSERVGSDPRSGQRSGRAGHNAAEPQPKVEGEPPRLR